MMEDQIVLREEGALLAAQRDHDLLSQYYSKCSPANPSGKAPSYAGDHNYLYDADHPPSQIQKEIDSLVNPQERILAEQIRAEQEFEADKYFQELTNGGRMSLPGGSH